MRSCQADNIRPRCNVIPHPCNKIGTTHRVPDPHSGHAVQFRKRTHDDDILAFANEIKNAYPGKDFDDLMNGVDEVIARGYVDDQNLFVYGCSGGGVLTSWIVGHTDRFAAASANCPVTNWLSFVGTTDGIGWYNNFETFPWEDPSEHLRRSSLMYVGNVTTPTMLMTGENDLRTPMPQTEEFYAALKVVGVESAMIRFKNEWHGTSRTPSNFLRTQLFLREWFKRYARMPSITD